MHPLDYSKLLSAPIRQASVDDIHSDQFLRISNYEGTIKQLDIYYGIGEG